jgi:hypothetical protein
MKVKRLGPAETVALLCRALQECFPADVFTVTFARYQGGAAACVRWTDGPSFGQVEPITRAFQGVQCLDGDAVRFGLAFVTLDRAYADAAVQRAIDVVYVKHEASFTCDRAQKPTVAQYRAGVLGSLQLRGLHLDRLQCVQADIDAVLASRTTVESAKPSPTLASVKPSGAGSNVGGPGIAALH